MVVAARTYLILVFLFNQHIFWTTPFHHHQNELLKSSRSFTFEGWTDMERNLVSRCHWRICRKAKSQIWAWLSDASNYVSDGVSRDFSEWAKNYTFVFYSIIQHKIEYWPRQPIPTAHTNISSNTSSTMDDPIHISSISLCSGIQLLAHHRIYPLPTYASS